jgi:hypothetical protein
MDLTDWSVMPDKINQCVVTQTPGIQAALNATPAVQDLWLHHHLASQQAFHDVNPFPASPLGTDVNLILPWMPDWIGGRINEMKTGILVVGSCYAPVVRPAVLRTGFRANSPLAAQFQNFCQGGDQGHLDLYLRHFWLPNDRYYGPLMRLFDQVFNCGPGYGKEFICLSDVVRASLVKVTANGVDSKEFSKAQKLALFWQYLQPSLSPTAYHLNVVARIEQMLVNHDRVAVICLGWFAEHLFAALVDHHWAVWSSENHNLIRPAYNPQSVPGAEQMTYATRRELGPWLNHPNPIDCWKWRRAADGKEIHMMPIFHPSRLNGHEAPVVQALQSFLTTAGAL